MEHSEGMVKYSVGPYCGWRYYYNWKLFVNHAWRDADLLAHHDEKCLFLFRYYMPNGKDYLIEIEIGHDGYFSGVGNTVNKNKPPRRWRVEAEWFEDNFLRFSS